MRSVVLDVKGQTPAQKNAKKIAVRGGRAMLYTEKRVKDWQDSAHMQLVLLRDRYQLNFTGRVQINYMFYVKDNRRRDIDNMIASINDALVKAKIIADDDWKHLRIGLGDAEVNKENPSAQISIRDISE